jgi:hypothetical protein
MIPCSKIGKRAGLRLAALFSVLLLSWAAAGALTARAAEEASAAASLVEAVVEAGQPAEYHLDITNGQPDEAPPAPTVEGLSISYAGPSQSRQYSFDGTVHIARVYTYVYSIETSRAGRFLIPGQEIRVCQRILSVAPVMLNVMGAGTRGGTAASQSYFVKLVIPQKSAYVGESIPAEVRVYFGWEVDAKVDPSPVLNGDGFSQQKFTPPQTSVEEVAGEQFRVVTYRTVLAGVKTGPVSVGPAEVTPTVRLPRTLSRRHSSFEDPSLNDPLSGFRTGPPKQVTLDSDSVVIDIKPLPPGQPTEFSGAIGQFQLETTATPARAATGDPVTLRLTLRGHGNFDRIEPPALVDQTGLRTYPATAKFKPADEVGLSGIKTFEQTVIARFARASFPGYRFGYFDPATGRYEVIETPPRPVAITGPAIASPTPAVAALAALSSPPPRLAGRPAFPGGLRIRSDFGRHRDAADFRPLYAHAGFRRVAGAAALGMLLLGVLVRWRRRAGDEALRRRATLQRHRADLRRTLQAEGTGRAAFYSAACRLAQLQATTPQSPQIASSIAQIYQRHEELAYSGHNAAPAPLPAAERREVLAALANLERN